MSVQSNSNEVQQLLVGAAAQEDFARNVNVHVPDPQRGPIFTKGAADVLDHATSEIAIGTKLGIDATRKLTGGGFKRPWPPLIRMSEEVHRKIDALFGK